MDPLNTAFLTGAALLAGAGVWLGLLYRARHVLNAWLVVSEPRVVPGGFVHLQVRLRPRRAVRVARVVARTRCLRRSLDAHHRPDHDPLALTAAHRPDESPASEQDVAGARTFEAGHLVVLEVDLPVGAGPPSSDQGPLVVHWVAEVQFEIPGALDVILRRPLVVEIDPISR